LFYFTVFLVRLLVNLKVKKLGEIGYLDIPTELEILINFYLSI